MKILFFILSVSTVLAVSFQSPCTSDAPTLIKTLADSIPDTLFYGLTAQQITTMSNVDIKTFCTKRSISLSKFVVTRTKAENYLLEKQFKRDSIEVARIYERIDKRLGIDK